MYSRKIAYFDLLDQGQKKGNAGFCKWEQRNDKHILTVLVSGLPKETSESVILYNSLGSELGNIKVSEGRGECVCHLQEGHDWSEELSSIHISFSKGIELAAEFQVESKKKEILVPQPIKEIEAPKFEKESTKGVAASKKILENIKEVLLEKDNPKAEEHKDSIEEQKQEVPVSGERIEPEPVSFWDWLEKTHEKVRPFGTEEEYYRIAVEDIYQLREEYHVLRNNQFLLHGYYNYHYLILGKKKGEECIYWLGVPGIYHEREKMAARMYGFEKFEGANPGYRIGDLGYYLITVESQSI